MDEFDQFADEYAAVHAANITASGDSPDYFAALKVADLAGEAARHDHAPQRILDFGSGIGNSLHHLELRFPAASIVCADPSARSLDIARKRHPHSAAEFVRVGARTLPFADQWFDVVFCACVFHHIAPVEHLHWLSELRRVTAPGGMLFLYEHNPLNPLTVSAVRNCPFDANAQLIRAPTLRARARAAGWQLARASYRVFFPRALSFARPVEPLLRWLPLGAQYFVLAWRQ